MSNGQQMHSRFQGHMLVNNNNNNNNIYKAP